MAPTVTASERSVLVIGADTRSCLAVIRSLGRAGVAVEAAGAPAHAPALRSRYVRRVHAVRGHDVDGLHALLSRRTFDLVIPCDDHASKAIHAQRARLDGLARVALVDDEAFTICNDKAQTHALGNALGIPVPAQRRAATARPWPRRQPSSAGPCALNYSGVGMVAFKVNPASGDWVLLEINARFWGSLPLSVAAGVDVPLYLFDLLTTGRRQCPQHYPVGVYARNWLPDARWLVRNLIT